jgi:hypothetical protein
MIDKWFNEEIQAGFAEHRYIVITDAKGEGEFLMRFLPQEIRIIDVKEGDWSELEAKYQAETIYANDKIVFYVKQKADALSYLQEYAQTANLLVLDDMEVYIKTKLLSVIGKNTHIGHDKLLLAAKLSEGKNLNWWQSVADGITEPLQLEEFILDFLNNPVATKQRMDDMVWNVFSSEVYRVIEKTATEQPAEAMAQEVVNVMFHSLINNSINDLLLNVYYQWADSTEKSTSLRIYANNYSLPNSLNPLDVHPDHPFTKLDNMVVKALSQAMKYGKDTSDIIKFIEKRDKSKKAISFKPQWLHCILTLCTFSIKGIENVDTYDKMAEYYKQYYSVLDTAMRKIYVAWLNDEATLRPLQEYYTILNKILLDKWYQLEQSYNPNQQNLLKQSLVDDIRTAVIVCDGLRLEIAETIVSGITDRNINISRNTAFAVLPTVTENGMSALFGCNEPSTNAQIRYNAIKTYSPEVEIMSLDKLNDSVTAKKLILNYGDIDQVGEKKQLGGLKDIDNYELELRERIATLFKLGYEKVVITTDHGFVITGILDEADKEPRPIGGLSSKVEERYVLSEYPIQNHKLIEREGKYLNSNYQYYAKTDKPFVSKGAYGYAHGGFTPQECIIPVYQLEMKQGDMSLKVCIANKKDLNEITGNYFVIKLQADGKQSDLFTQERKVKLMLFAGNQIVNTTIHTLKPGTLIEAEYELSSGINKVVVSDKETSVQIDSCDIKKSSSRDLDDLF